MDLRPHINKFKQRYGEVEAALSDPAAFDNPQRAQELAREYARLKALVALGETRDKLAHVAELAGLRDVALVEPEEDAEATLREAVRQAAYLAEPGDAVLLSPACASWDMFKSYEQRGSIFKQSAHTL